MFVSRHGAFANHGLRSIELKDLTMKWDGAQREVKLTCPDAVYDFATDATHRYHVRFSLEELAQLVQTIGDECKNMSPEEFENAFAPIVPSIVRMMNTACRAN